MGVVLLVCSILTSFPPPAQVVLIQEKNHRTSPRFPFFNPQPLRPPYPRSQKQKCDARLRYKRTHLLDPEIGLFSVTINDVTCWYGYYYWYASWCWVE